MASVRQRTARARSVALACRWNGVTEVDPTALAGRTDLSGGAKSFIAAPATCDHTTAGPSANAAARIAARTTNGAGARADGADAG